MKIKQRNDYLVKCPYYSKEGLDEMICTGLYKRSNIKVTFATGGHVTKKIHKECYCKDLENYNNCPVARMLTEHYERNSRRGKKDREP